LFESIDTNGDGRLDKEEMHAAFPHLGSEQVQALMRAADQDSDGCISFEELWALIQADESGGGDEELPGNVGSDDLHEVRQIFSPVRFEAQAFQLGEASMVKQIQDPEASLAKLFQRASALFDDFDMTETGMLGRIQLAVGLEDYGYLEVERDIIFHVMDHNHDGKITFPSFFRSIWVLSEHVIGLGYLLQEAYGEPINEEGLRRVIAFLTPRIITLQRHFRHGRRARALQNYANEKKGGSAKGVVLAVHVLRGEKLKAMDSNGFSDAYLTFKVGADRTGKGKDTSKKGQTKVVARSLNPEWDEKFEVELSPDEVESPTEMLSIQVWDRDKDGDDDLIGEFMLCLSDIVKTDLDGTRGVTQEHTIFGVSSKESSGVVETGPPSKSFLHTDFNLVNILHLTFGNRC